MLCDELREKIEPEVRHCLALYKERGVTGWTALLLLTKDLRTPKTAVINPYRGEEYFNSLSQQEKGEILALSPIADKTPRLFNQFTPAERYEIGRVLRHLKLMVNAMPDRLKVSDFHNVKE